MVYIPAEDSFLISEVIKKKLPKLVKEIPELKFLEIGAGSGINLMEALTAGVKKENIFSCDIDAKAVQQCQKIGFNSVKSDLFENITGKFNLIVFNPPYLPEDKREPKDSKLQTTGGKKGSEVINEFLKNAKDYLEENGKIFLLTSSLTKGIKWNNFKKKQIATQKLFFEQLYVFELNL